MSVAKTFIRKSLCEEIKSILQTYPDDGQIFKEIIQNAEDAGATEVVFIYDKNELHTSKEYHCPKLTDFQGPSLYSYNNAKFTDSDWEGILKLGTSNKVKDALKVGRFGLGFKSVFHLTDLPVVISDGVTVLMDPMKKVFNSEVIEYDMTKTENIALVQNKGDFEPFKRLPKKYWDVGVSNGSLFRFPLRKTESELSTRCYSNEMRFQKLIDKFLDEAFLSLIFLKNIKTMKFFIIDNGSKEVEEIYSLDGNNTVETKPFTDQIKQNVKEKQFEKTEKLNRHLKLNQMWKGNLRSYSYAISEHFGYSGSDDDFKAMMHDEELSYIPLLSVALPLDDSDPGGHVFSALPLPLHTPKMTGMPVHINGFFALLQDRKDLKWKTLTEGGSSNDKTVNWNSCLITELAPVVYADLMTFLVTDFSSAQVYKAWPCIDAVDQRWHIFLEKFYKNMLSIKFIYLENVKDFALLTNVHLINAESFSSCQQKSLISDFTLTNLKVAEVPISILKCFERHNLLWLDSTTLIKLIMQNQQQYHTLPIDDKAMLLEFAIKSTNDWQQIYQTPLLPLVNGSHISLSTTSTYLVENEDFMKILPSKEHLLDFNIFKQSQSLLDSFKEWICDRNNVSNVMVVDSFEKLCKAIIILQPQEWRNEQTIKWPSPNILSDWNVLLLKEIRYNWNHLSLLEGVPLILTTNQYQSFLWKLSKQCQPILNSNLSEQMKAFLNSCGVHFVNEEMLQKDDLYYLKEKGFILEATEQKIINLIERQHQQGINIQTCLENHQSEELFCELISGLSKCENIPQLFFTLPIFKVHNSTIFVNSQQCNIIDRKNISESWTSKMFPLVCKDQVKDSLIKSMKLRELNFVDVCHKMLDYNNLIPDPAEFYDEILKKAQSENMILPAHFIHKLAPVLTLRTNGDGPRVSISSLFQPTNILKDAFQAENRFPAPDYSIEILTQLLPKSEKNVSLQDLMISITLIANNTSLLNQSTLFKKVNAILKLGNANNLNLPSNINWIPTAKKPSDYPTSLKWLDETLSSPALTFSFDDRFYIGASHYMVHEQLNQSFLQCYQKHLRKPTVAELLQNLQIVESSYDSDEKGAFKKIIFTVYEELSKQANQILPYRQMLHHLWQGDRFVPISKIKLCDMAIDLTPYYFDLPKEIPQTFVSKVVSRIIDDQNSFQLCIDVLKQISVNNNASANENYAADFQLSIKLVHYLVENHLDECLTDKSQLMVPVEGSGLKLCPANDCYSIDKVQSTKYTSTVSSNNIIHSDLGQDVAAALKVPSLISKVLGGRKSRFFKACGQTEPLTLRLKRLLDEYRDGLAIIKELVQNADDAGAHTVKLLYDRRVNGDKRDLLVDQGMKDWQGPALWIYNDKMFTEEDFENITKLNAGTKEYDTKKIGKFGLGFNSVYHLTDVPSFLSGDSIVIFDPHTTYLGDALESKDVPGIRIPLSENIKELSSFRHQFEVFDSIFGAKFDFDSEVPFTHYEGTLFRLPFRRQETVEKSDIKKLEYSDSEMNKLFENLKSSLHDLILFTEKVKHVEVWEKKGDGLTTKLFEVNKKTINGGSNIIELANQQLSSLQQNPHQPICDNSNNLTTISSIDVHYGEQLVSSTNWLISSSIGGPQTFNYALQNKGHLPCGGVALPFTVQNNQKTIKEHNGKLYCFLPLPIKSHLSVHLNAAFDVTKNRQNLETSSSDDKSYSKNNKHWNELLSMDLGKAFYNLVTVLPQHFPQLTIDEWMSQILPDEQMLAHNMHSELLVKDFLVKLLNKQDQHKVIPTPGGWKPWNSILNLDQEFDNDNIIPDAIKFVNLVNSGKQCVLLPNKFCKLLDRFGFTEDLKQVTINKEKLFTMFLTSLRENRELDQEIRMKLLDYLLQSKPIGPLEEMIKNTQCIPTKPNNKFVFPKELVKEKSKASKIYTIDDEVFANVSKQHNDYLTQLGMQTHKLPWSMLIERARSVVNLSKSSNTSASERLSALLMLIGECGQPSANDLQQLRDLPFIESLSQPKNRQFLPWFTSETNFAKPSQMFSNELSDVVSCTSLVSKNALPANISSIVKSESDFSTDIIVSQLKHLVTEYKRKGMLSQNMSDVLHQIYFHLPKVYNPYPQLKDIACIRTSEDHLAKPSDVFFEIEAPIPGHLHRVHPELQRRNWMNLMISFGVQQVCTPQNFINLFEMIHQNDWTLSKQATKAIIHGVIPYLHGMNYDISPEELYLPDDNGKMYPVHELCYREDIEWLPDDENVKYLHSEFPWKFNKYLHIKSLRADLMIRHPEASELWGSWCEFGQKEPLTTRIKNLLSGYSHTQDIFKEMFQNADDAGATEIEFILDRRNHNKTKVFSEKWKPLQGPAFLVCNNGKFTARDLKGIQNLGTGSKREDPLTTGKYGVGFNAVYSITDCPVLLTHVEEFDDVLCIFDPNRLYAEGATEQKPGRMMKSARRLLQKYPDVMSSLLLNEIDTSGKTLFRFPLRNEDMSKTSEISNSSISADKVNSLMYEIKSRANDILLFLKNISSVKFTIITQDGKFMEERFTVHNIDVSISEFQKFKDYQRNFPSKLTSIEQLEKCREMLIRRLCVQHWRGKKLFDSFHWEVIEQCGFSDIELKDDLKRQVKKQQLKLVPKGGIAKLLENDKCVHCKDLEKKPPHQSSTGEKKVADTGVFCTLPIPCETGFPAIVNGSFILEYETRRNLKTSSELDKSWNNSILEGCVLPCYIKFILRRVEEISGQHEKQENTEGIIRKFYENFPHCQSMKDDYWKGLTKKFYTALYQKNSSVLLVNKNGEIIPCAPQEDFIVYPREEIPSYTPSFSANSFSSTTIPTKTAPNLLTVMKAVLLHTDTIPFHVENNFKQIELPLTVASPALIRDVLVTLASQILPTDAPVHIKDTLFGDTSNLITLLDYCVKDCVNDSNSQKQEDEKPPKVRLDGLPLCLLANDHLTTFSVQDAKFCTQYFDFFPREKPIFVHGKVFSVTRQKPLLDKSCFKYFDLEAFHDMLNRNFDEEGLKSLSEPILLSNTNLKQHWVKRFWQFIGTLKSHCDQDERELNLDIVRDWSLLLVQKDEYGAHYLMPIRERKHALNFRKDPINPLNNILKRIGVFQPAMAVVQVSKELQRIEDLYKDDIRDWLFGQVSDPNDVINAMYLVKSLSRYDLDTDEAEIILTYLTQHLKMYGEQIKCIPRLKSLQIFEKFNKQLTSIENAEVIMLPSGIPHEGLQHVQDMKSCVLLKHNSSHLDLFKFLGINCMEWHEFYYSYILPCTNHFSNQEMESHLVHLRIQISYLSKEGKQKIWNLIQKLKEMKLFPNKHGQKTLCKDMYRPTERIFAAMLPDECFPAEQYRGGDWMHFLVELGLVDELNRDLFLRFARELSTADDFKKVETVSELLCDRLSYNEEEFQCSFFLRQLSNINFLIPHKVLEAFEKIHCSRNSQVDRICFRDSCFHSLEKLIWTSKFLLPQYSTNPIWRKPKLMEKLGIVTKDTVSTDFVLTHFKHILNKDNNFKQVTSTYKEIKEQYCKTYVNVLEEFYDSDHLVKSKEMLEDLSCVVVFAGKGLEVPSKSITGQESTIYPYLNTVPVTFGKYFDNLTEIGCSKEVNVSHLVNVLKDIYEGSDSNPLGPNELEDSKKAVCYLSSKIMTDTKNSIEDNLYLPTVSFVNKGSVRMILSTDALFVDDTHMEERLKKFHEPLLMFSYGKELDSEETTNKRLMTNLQKCRRPKVLSESIVEKLTEESENKGSITVSSSHISKELKRRIKHPIFIHCIERLFRFENLDVSSVVQSLANVQVTVRPSIETNLLYQEIVIPDSQMTKKISMRIHDDSLQIYFSLDAIPDRKLESDIAEGFLMALSNKLTDKKSILALPLLLSEDISSLPGVLDERNITRGSEDSDFKKLGNTPIPGEPVPAELHQLLRQDFSSFEIDEYVAVQQTDSDEPHFYYAIFRRDDYNPNETSRIYGLQLGEEEDEITDVPSYMVFKFERSFVKATQGDDVASDFSVDFAGKSLEDIKQEIKKIFENMIGKDKKTQKLILKRLYLAWHPDKHSDETKDLATEVFKYIQHLLQKLKSGENFDVDTDQWNQYASSWRNYYRGYRSRYRSWGGCHYSSGYNVPPPTFQPNNPQPGEARRWWRQANHDVNAAREINVHHEWACYIAHQAAEKALKAAIYLKNYQRLMSHDLDILSMQYSPCSEWASQLQSLVGRAERMRYPDNWSAPIIPHSQYDADKARRAIEYARKIVDHVGNIVNR
ncbi:sacsin-like [Clytia hemisphaerica]|uniref:HEPN domain-containing protein n=1 Tax=Clytia hemisphaerica TaxID=252671 RepID=A0A7M5WTY6_9CNID